MSGTPLIKKLGIKEGQKIAILNAGKDYDATLGKLPDGVTVSRSLNRGQFDLVQIFATNKEKLEKEFLAAKKILKPDGAIWVSWPKLSSGMETDLSGDVVREVGLKSGLVDVKVCAVDQTWSGLKFVLRLKDRK
jgi:Protein of unknown function (DUF3052)